MITLDLQVSGETLGRQLVDDPEELGRCLAVMAEDTRNAPRLGEEVWQEGIPYREGEAVVKFLRDLAQGIEEAMNK